MNLHIGIIIGIIIGTLISLSKVCIIKKSLPDHLWNMKYLTSRICKLYILLIPYIIYIFITNFGGA